MYKTKLNKIQNLIEKVKSDISFPIISDFLDWFLLKINIHFNKETPNLKLNKWEIYFIKLWQNIWSELNKQRPCIIYSTYFFNNWNTITVIPLKSYNWKRFNKNVNVFIKSNNTNNLKEDSIADISWIMQISKKRLELYIWKTEEEFIFRIDKKLMKFFWIKNKQ